MSRKNRGNFSIGDNKLRIVFMVIAVIFLIITIRLYSSIMRTNMLPSMYIIIITTVEIFITLLLAIGLVKRHKTLKLNIICLVIIIIMTAGYLFANHYIDITMNFLGSMLTETEEVEEYYVIVKKDSGYNNLEDLKNKTLHIFQIEDDVKEKIMSKTVVTFKTDDDLIGLGNDLIGNKAEAMVASASQYEMLQEEIEDFENKTKIIATETHKLDKTTAVEDTNSKYTVETGVFNIYISGIDTYGNIKRVSRSDSNMILTVNLNTNQILLTSIPRDYYVTLHSKKAKDKLTHSGIYGINETVTTVEDFLGIDINYYVRVNFSTLIKLIDTLGGVDIVSDYNFTAGGYSFSKGTNHLDGEKALVFSRERHSFANGDNQRVQNQQKVVEAIISKALNSKTILTKYTSILESLSGSFNTNLEQDEISSIVRKQLESMPRWKITTNALTGSGTSSTTYSMGKQKLYVMIPNQSSVEEAKTKINAILAK